MSIVKLIQAGGARGRAVGTRPRRVGRVLGTAVVATCGVLVTPAQIAPAQECPDVEVVFARGTAEPPGVGGVGQGFVDALRQQIAPRSLGVYAVNYPASSDFTAGLQFAMTVIDGIKDAGAHVQSTAATCPDTEMVLGGFSQGAVVAGFTTADAVPEGVPAGLVPAPMPPEVADHVAAVVLFGKPSDRWMRDAGAPPVAIGPLYAPKTIDLCEPGDTICNGSPIGGPNGAHALYAVNGMVGQGAAFAASKLAPPA